MRPAAAPVLAWLSVTLALAGCGSSSSASSRTAESTAGAPTRPPASGIAGRALAAPTCPVQRVGQTCTRPYAARLLIFTATGHHLARVVRAAASGRFAARLPPGRYVILASHRLPRLAPVRVTVRPGRFTRITLVFDTGIR